MNWKASPPRLETAAVAIAAACLGGAVAFAVARVAPFGAGLVEASVTGACVALCGWLLAERVDRRRQSRLSFGPVDSLSDALVAEDVLLLDQRVDDSVLLLDDPLPAIDDDMRVVRLFATQPPASAEATAFAGPGEMVARIEDWLGQARGGVAAAAPPRPAERAAAEEASAALHAALADIRRSLRQS